MKTFRILLIVLAVVFVALVAFLRFYHKEQVVDTQVVHAVTATQQNTPGPDEPPWTSTPTPPPTQTFIPTSTETSTSTNTPTETPTVTATATLVVKIGVCPVERVLVGQRENKLEYTIYNGKREEIVYQAEMDGDCSHIENLTMELPLSVYNILRTGGTVVGFKIDWKDFGLLVTPLPRAP